MERKSIGTEKALEKIRYFCSYQERCHREVKEKLYGYGLYKADAELLLSQMIEEGYLNEERFAVAFAGGKFRTKKWGRRKIRNELMQKGLSAFCIQAGLASIEEEDYFETMKKLAGEKLRQLSAEKNEFIKDQKVRAYLVQKGYEPELLSEVLKRR